MTVDCLDANLEETEREATIEKLLSLPLKHFMVLIGVTGWENPHSGEIIQPVTTAEIQENDELAQLGLGDRAMRGVITELKTMGLLDTWIEEQGRPCETGSDHLRSRLGPRGVAAVR